jgi:hypothetical protein
VENSENPLENGLVRISGDDSNAIFRITPPPPVSESDGAAQFRRGTVP